MPGPAAKARTAEDELAARAAIERLTIEYAYLLDHGEATRLADLFTPDGVLETDSARLIGRAAIASYYAKRAKQPWTTRHISTNLRVMFEAPDRASGTRLILYFRGEGTTPPFAAGPGSVGEYREIYVRGHDGRWRFASRVNQILFRARR
ncbi:nuclear transport factor 2 family protein [Sphingomonas turrisvirgatae]|uniref:SnoaL-like domain-containing protein n=1 Tax=Sphingomonas turrisvirgatae TaxID=1888892 RepID=A0A1E3LR84_9SPHN|nr:nuclear transport factor 2 family protein [Sphingomonas turrisvirgatae]ODP36279.1 hypothetical protein BFL28_06135 [Sphingomonas turrisvirgatae]